MSRRTYIDGFVEDLQGKEFDIVVLGQFHDLVNSHPRLFIAFKLV